MGGRKRSRFWTKPLGQMTPEEWERLCDGCGKCCMVKLEDEDTGEIAYTDVACRLFDDTTCRCGSYALRAKLVLGCVVLAPGTMPEVAHWLPATCAYRLRYEGKPLPRWHPLITGDAGSVHAAGISMQGRTIPEWEVPEDELEDHVLDLDAGNGPA